MPEKKVVKPGDFWKTYDRGLVKVEKRSADDTGWLCGHVSEGVSFAYAVLVLDNEFREKILPGEVKKVCADMLNRKINEFFELE